MKSSFPIYSSYDKDQLTHVGALAAKALDYVCEFVKEGITTNQINQKFIEFLHEHKANAACYGFHGYPKHLCVSINDEICHGIPSQKIIRSGDVVSVDLVVEQNGYYADTCKTIKVGKIPARIELLIDVTHKAMMNAINAVKIGQPLSVIGLAIENTVKEYAFGIVKDYCGHGIGKQLHHEPQILHYYSPKHQTTLIQEGMCFTIEPMICEKRGECKVDSDNWTVRTIDRSVCAQFEHTIFVNADSVTVLT